MTASHPLSASDIDEYCFGFFGYGDLSAPIWFVGMEEGGGGSSKEVTNRIRAWHSRGRHVVEDVAAFHDAFLKGGFSSIKRQPTWIMLSRIHLGFEQGAADISDPKKHWQQVLGRHGSGTCVLELNPLPSPGTAKWNYPEYTDFRDHLFLANREVYNLRYRARRVEKLRSLVEEYSPSAVVFYGKRYQPFWEVIAGGLFGSGDMPRMLTIGATTFVSMEHPSARVSGRSGRDLRKLGQSLAEA